LLDRRLELEEEDFALKRRQDAARVQAGLAEQALKEVQRRLERALRRQAPEA
jgi:hypothetical protein